MLKEAQQEFHSIVPRQCGAALPGGGGKHEDGDCSRIVPREPHWQAHLVPAAGYAAHGDSGGDGSIGLG